MNDERRNKIKELEVRLEIEVLECAEKLRALLQDTKWEYEEIYGQEETAYEALPESLQDGIIATGMQDAMRAMEGLLKLIETHDDNVEDLLSDIDEMVSRSSTARNVEG